MAVGPPPEAGGAAQNATIAGSGADAAAAGGPPTVSPDTEEAAEVLQHLDSDPAAEGAGALHPKANSTHGGGSDGAGTEQPRSATAAGNVAAGPSHGLNQLGVGAK